MNYIANPIKITPEEIFYGHSYDHRSFTDDCSVSWWSTVNNIPLSKADNETSERVKDYIRASSSEATLRAYKSDLEHLLAWGREIPASLQSVANYLADHVGVLSVSTLSRRVAALSKIHGMRGMEDSMMTINY